MEGNAHRLRNDSFLLSVVRETVRWKLALLDSGSNVEAEFHLQYGHCIGHGIETASRYSLLHGEAIAIGMMISAEISTGMALANSDLIVDHLKLLQAYQLPTFLPESISIDVVVDAMQHDKNVARGIPRIALLREVGCLYRSDSEPYVQMKLDCARHYLEANQQRSRTPEKAGTAWASSTLPRSRKCSQS